MSAGNFQTARYVDNDGGEWAIRVQPETLALSIGGNTNSGGSGSGQTNGYVRVSNRRRQFGLTPRKVSIRFTGAVPDGYSGDPISGLPLLNSAIYDAATPLATGTYLGEDIEVVSRSDEFLR